MSGFLERLLLADHRLFMMINSGDGAAWNALFGYGTYLGDGVAITLILFLVTRFADRNRFPKNFILLSIALLLSGGVEQILKHAVERPRPLGDPYFNVGDAPPSVATVPPFLVVSEYKLRYSDGSETGQRLKILGPKWKKNSFPSGHTAAAFGLATGFLCIFRRKKWVLGYLPAAFVGVSRAACGVHFPLDIFAGALLGLTFPPLFLRAFEIYHGLGSLPDTRPPGKRSGPLKIMMVVGEASADTYGSLILEELKKKHPGLTAVGVGGEKMKRAGLQTVADAHELSIVGFTAVLTSLSAILRIYGQLFRLLRDDPPDALVCIDLPDFNLMLAIQARTRSIPVLYFISPQFWAWRQGRVRRIADRISRMIVAFPFEEPFYKEVGVPVAFHGHPILETLHRRFEDRDAACGHFGLDPKKKTLVLAPGSRRNEFKYIRDDMFVAGAQILSAFPDWQAAVPLAPGASEEEMREAAGRAGLKAVFTRGENFDLFSCADFGIICSGTATLEAALAALPMLIVYRGHRLNLFLARRLVKIDRIGLPNIILGGEKIEIPELIQHDADAKPLAEKALAALRDRREYDRLRAAGLRVRETLKGGRTSEAVAMEILKLTKRT